MRFRVALLVPIALLPAWPLAVAHAQDAPKKAPDVMTVDGVTQPVPAHGTTPDLSGTAAPTRAAKPVSEVTALPFDLSSLSPAQLAKRGSAPPAPAGAPEPAGVKAPDVMTALPAAGPAPGRKVAPAPDARSIVGVFGQLPRPEWTRGLPLKPEEIVTVGPATGLDAPASAALPAASPARRKAPDVRTSLPRDPGAPAPAAAKPEVRP